MAIGGCNCGVGFKCTGYTLCTVQSLVWVYVHYIVFSHFYLCRITTWSCGEESKEGISHGTTTWSNVAKVWIDAMYMQTGDCNCGVDRLDIVQSLAWVCGIIYFCIFIYLLMYNYNMTMWQAIQRRNLTWPTCSTRTTRNWQWVSFVTFPWPVL